MSAKPIPDAAFFAALTALPGMGPRRIDAIVGDRGPRATWSMLCSASGTDYPGHLGVAGVSEALVARWRSEARDLDVDEMWRRHTECRIDVLTAASADWPIDEEFDPAPPAVLFGTGPLTGRQSPAVAIVGSRRSTHYGRNVAATLGRGLAAHGVAVVSGLAVGIDGAAQRAALDAGGRVVGVVGSGLDVIYPRNNARLWTEVAAKGRLWSEAPLGVEPAKWRFPARNRIIAALADVVVVVESVATGGSLHTVDAALERDRVVMAVPGPVTSPQSLGTNPLLVQGCAPVSELSDVLVALGLSDSSCGGQVPDVTARHVDEHLVDVLEAVDYDGTSIDTVMARTGLEVSTVLSRLSELESVNHVKDIGGWWQRS